jgi:hypothetical protein
MKLTIAALAGIAALGLTACSKPAPAPQPESSSAAPAPASVAAVPVDPKAFLTSLYAHYDGSQSNFSPFDAPGDYFDPQLLALMDANDRATPDDEVGALDGDPICDCQDYQKLRADITVTSVKDDTAEAEVKLRDAGAKPKLMTYKLAQVGGKWRIHDIGTKDMPSLRRLLINSTPKA